MSDLEQFPEQYRDRLAKIPSSERKTLLREYKHLGQSAPGVVISVYYRRRYTDMNVSELRELAKKLHVYTIWTDGSQKNKTDLINSLVLYQDDKKQFLKRQEDTIGAKEPKIRAKSPKKSPSKKRPRSKSPPKKSKSPSKRKSSPPSKKKSKSPSKRKSSPKRKSLKDCLKEFDLDRLIEFCEERDIDCEDSSKSEVIASIVRWKSSQKLKR